MPTEPGKTVTVTLKLWTNDESADSGRLPKGSGWFAGVVDIPKKINERHELRSLSAPVPFNRPEDLLPAIRKAAKAAKLDLLYPEATRSVRCEYCGQRFGARRRSARFCSDSCRAMAWKRAQ